MVLSGINFQPDLKTIWERLDTLESQKAIIDTFSCDCVNNNYLISDVKFLKLNLITLRVS